MGTLSVDFGVLHSTAEPFTEPESLRVEFLPFDGESMVFGGEGSTPDRVAYDGEIYTRV